MPIQRTCAHCGGSFYVSYPSDKRTFCGRSCSKLARPSGNAVAGQGARVVHLERVCPCGKTMTVPPWRVRQAERGSGVVYCSRDCANKFRPLPTGRNKPRTGSRFVDSEGYARVYVPPADRNPGREHRAYEAEHRLVMEAHLGRALFSGENVHHINGVKDDNRIENLELWVTSQPAGQRPADLLAWADEIIRRYRYPEAATTDPQE